MIRNSLTELPLYKMNGKKDQPGSFLLGAEIYYGIVNADSALVPDTMAIYINNRAFIRSNFLK
jgi:hypothetical protein